MTDISLMLYSGFPGSFSIENVRSLGYWGGIPQTGDTKKKIIIIPVFFFLLSAIEFLMKFHLKFPVVVGR